ncbi:MAG: saccharopine dehydrogenase NADP-binding domain-containing protein [Deltaproteobacteria bacterium]|jgi:lysine 6-dehydrogenase|nr:saccharopine dehydrogenase NADP-binding domain-containing protein [Deltaproteobacteria bacterium]
MKTIVLGGGLVGAPMALDLAEDKDINVTVADISDGILKKFKTHTEIKTIKQDLSDRQGLKEMISSFDMVINAVPGFMGYKTLETIIKAGKNVVDIAFFPEDALTLDALAKKHDVTAVVDCGVAPGMSNMLTGYADHLLDKTRRAVIYVGGLPEIRTQPWEYKAVFSPIDVIEEYIRPAFYVEKGRVVEKPALSEPELIDFPELGTLEVFNTDGLRSLIKNLDIPDMKEKTMRYPGHIEKILFLKDAGFFNEEPVRIGSEMVRPIDMTAKLLFPQWKLEPGEKDITVMQIIVQGEKDGKKREYRWDLLDRYDSKTKTHSMARTTGYTATTVLRLLKKGLFDQKGIITPEIIGKDETCVKFVLENLKQKNIVYKQTITDL